MRKRFILIKATKLQLSFSCKLCFFQNINLWHTFQTLTARKHGIAHLYFLYQTESLPHCLSYDFKQMARSSVQFFQRVQFLRDPLFSSCKVHIWVRFLDNFILFQSLPNWTWYVYAWRLPCLKLFLLSQIKINNTLF